MKLLVYWEFLPLIKYTYTVNKPLIQEPCFSLWSRKALFFSLLLLLAQCTQDATLVLAPGVSISTQWQPKPIAPETGKTFFFEYLCEDSSCHYYTKAIAVQRDTLICSDFGCSALATPPLIQTTLNRYRTPIQVALYYKIPYYSVRYTIQSPISKSSIILDQITYDESKARALYAAQMLPGYIRIE